MTKEKILEILSQYNPGSFRSFKGIFGIQSAKSEEIIAITNWVNLLPAGEISPEKLEELITLLNQYKPSTEKRETGRVIGLIFAEIAKEYVNKAIERAIDQNLISVKQKLSDGVGKTLFDQFYLHWRNSYYFNHTHNLMLMMQEVSGVKLEKASGTFEHALAVALLSFVLYSAFQEKTSPIMATYAVQTLLSNIKLDRNISSYFSKELPSFVEYLPSLTWWLGFALQSGLDVTTGAGGYLVSAYVGGTVMQSVFSKITTVISVPSWLQNYTVKYPATYSCVKQYLSDASFGFGAYLGNKVYSGIYYFSQSHQQESHSQKDKKEEHKDNSQQSKKSDQKNNSQEKEHSHERTTKEEQSRNKKTEKPNFSENISYEWKNTSNPQHCKKFAPIVLTEYEKNLISREESCDSTKSECLQIAYRVMGLDPHKPHSNKEAKRAYKSLSLFWHPDHYSLNCENKNDIATQQMEYLNDARTAWERIGKQP